jgi:MlaD protein
MTRSGIVAGSGYSLLADFDHIDGQGVGADVRIAGVKVGSVTDEKPDPKTFLAVVSMTVPDGIQLPLDTGAVITSDTLLPGKIIVAGRRRENLEIGSDDDCHSPRSGGAERCSHDGARRIEITGSPGLPYGPFEDSRADSGDQTPPAAATAHAPAKPPISSSTAIATTSPSICEPRQAKAACPAVGLSSIL